VEPPVPIPNTEVKRFSADDTQWVTFWENMPLPGVIKKHLLLFQINPDETNYSSVSKTDGSPLTCYSKILIIRFKYQVWQHS
jgi:urate oxidase